MIALQSYLHENWCAERESLLANEIGTIKRNVEELTGELADQNKRVGALRDGMATLKNGDLDKRKEFQDRLG